MNGHDDFYYDFGLGDRRFVDFDDAISFANTRALDTGLRQRVKRDSAPRFVGTLWLVKAV